MTTNYKTQCPRCHTLYPMPIAKLGDDKARANCGKCQHTFFLNAHLVDVAIKPAVIDTTAIADDPADHIPITKPSIKAKKPKPIAKEGMIYDDMSDDDKGSDVEFDMGELDAFMNNDSVIAPVQTTAATNKNATQDNNDEAWLNDLLKDNKVEIDHSLNKHRPDDSLSDILGVDLENMIPVAEPISTHPNQPDVYQKIQARLENHAPTQEQLAKKRSLGSRMMWTLGCLLMVGLLGLQYIFFNTDSLIKNPEHASTLNAVCGILPCGLPHADSNAFNVSHQIQSVSESKSNLLITLTNNSSREQLYPNIKVTLIGNDGVIGELIATPRDYLVIPQRLMIANQQKPLMLGIDLPSADIKSINIEPFF